MRTGRKKYDLLLLLALLWLVFALLIQIQDRSRASILKSTACTSEEFRMQKIKPSIYREIRKLSGDGASFGDLMTASMLNGKFAPERVDAENASYLKYKKEEYLSLKKCYEAVWADLVYFPLPEGSFFFENTWMAPRDYGGERVHEGTDLFGESEEPGVYPIISMTSGVVEKTGWLPLGGYRIGIRSAHGGYFYYAHLSEYTREFQLQEKVAAGDILGYMGNTGYGPEGTAGKFPVHLHLGIYLQTEKNEEISVNPYWVLKALEKNKRKYTY